MALPTTSNSAADIAIVAGVVATGTTVIRRVRRKQSSYMVTVVYGFLATLVLVVLAMPLPTIAKWLSYMLMVGAITVNGPEIFKMIEGLSK